MRIGTREETHTYLQNMMDSFQKYIQDVNYNEEINLIGS